MLLFSYSVISAWKNLNCLLLLLYPLYIGTHGDDTLLYPSFSFMCELKHASKVLSYRVCINNLSGLCILKSAKKLKNAKFNLENSDFIWWISRYPSLQIFDSYIFFFFFHFWVLFQETPWTRRGFIGAHCIGRCH